jgi:hypothetical protein
MRRRTIAVLVSALLWLSHPLVSGAATDGDIIAAIRAARGDDLAVIATLQGVADARAPQIVTDFSHDGPGAAAARAPLAGWAWGETIAFNGYPSDLTVGEALGQWLASPEHRAILLGSWAGFGAAVATSPSGAHYYVAIFGTPPGARPSRPTPEPRQAAARPRAAPPPAPTPVPSPPPEPPDAYPLIRYPDRMTSF